MTEDSKPAALLSSDALAEATAGDGRPSSVVPATQLGLPNVAFGLSVTNSQMEVVKKVTSEHITQEISNSHDRALRQLQLHERAIEDEEAERVREHERDKRDRAELLTSDSRIERMFYVVFGTVAVLCLALVLKDKGDLAIKVVGAFAAILVALAGGVGVERLRQDRARRRGARLGRKADAEDVQRND